LWTAEKVTPDSAAKYGITLLIPKDTDISEMEDIVRETAKEEWPKLKPGAYDSPITDGDEAKYEGYKGYWVVKFRSKNRPRVVGMNPKVQLEEEEFQAGCEARVSYTPNAYDVAGKGVNFYLGNVQKTGVGEPFAAVTDPEDDFDEIEPPEEDESFLD